MIKVNGEIVKVEHFPNGEMKIAPLEFGVHLPIGQTQVGVTLIFETNEDLITLMFVKSYLDDKTKYSKINLYMSYIAYSRMDRQTSNQMFTSKYFGNFINKLNFYRIYVLDPHSNVSVAVLDRVRELPIRHFVYEAINLCSADYIFYPDNGAKKKYVEVLEDINLPYFYGDKHRDLETGKITDYNVFNVPDLSGKTILIVDDLCVKGYTTLFAAKKLKELGAKEVYFYCSHCEPAIFDGELLTTDYVDGIFTTDSMIRDKHPKIEVI